MSTSPEAKTIENDDLDLISPNLADDGKSEEDIWNELAADEKTAAGAPEAQDGGDEPAEPSPAPAASPEAGKTASPAAPAAADIWASAPAELKAAYEAEKQAREKAEKDRKAAIDRVAPVQRKLDQLQRAVQPSNRPSKVKEAREALRQHEDEYPEIAKPVAQALDAIAEKDDADETSRRAAAANELADIESTATATLAEKHPDWDVFLKKHGGPAFAEWVDDQPRRIREAFLRNGNAIVDAHGAIALLDAYKAHVATIEGPKPVAPVDPNPNPPTSLNEKRQRQLAATTAPSRAGGRPAVSGIPEEGDPQAIWDAFEAQEQRARA